MNDRVIVPNLTKIINAGSTNFCVFNAGSLNRISPDFFTRC